MMESTQTRKRSRPIERDAVEDDDRLYTTRLPTSTRRYHTTQHPLHETLDDTPLPGTPIQQRRSIRNTQPAEIVHKVQPPHTSGIVSDAVTSPLSSLKKLRVGKHRIPWLYVLLGMLLAVALVLMLSAFSSWWSVYQDDLHYGRPRTYQFDAVVGHNDSTIHPTHFILLNLHGHIDIIEIPGGDAAKARIFTGPTLYGNTSDLTPVTGSVRDVNHDGKPELIIHVQGQDFVFLNDGKTFHSQ